MKILDFGKSFIVFEIDLDQKPAKTVSQARQNSHNRARIQIDCRCRITDSRGVSADYYLGESCKTERVGATREVGIFTQPNADFRPVLSEEYAMFFKSWEKNDRGIMLEPPSLGAQLERHVIEADEAFYRHALQLRQAEGQLLCSVEEIMEATENGDRLVARTEYARFGYRVLLEYPIFTMNVSQKHKSYQTDTGPVIFPELSRPHELIPDSFHLAFCAFNAPDWIEFIVQKPTRINDDISVNHYSTSVSIEGCRNSIFRTS